MPELPEVETLRRGLDSRFSGRLIQDAEILVPKMLKGNVSDSGTFARLLRGKKIENIHRRGKHLIFRLENGYYLLLHLNMRGQLLWSPEDEPRAKYLAAVLKMDNGEEIRFHDIWRWGEIRLADEAQMTEFAALRCMGPEPLCEEWTPDIFARSLQRFAKTAIKTALLNQTLVAGVGNIYADEALFRAGILSIRPAGSLDETEVRRLHRSIQETLTEATQMGGTKSGSYIDIDGNAGRYVPQVYDRANEACPTCARPLTKIRIGGRGSTFCEFCQQ